MKVWVLLEHCDEGGDEVFNVYSTREKADSVHDELENNSVNSWYEVVEKEVVQ